MALTEEMYRALVRGGQVTVKHRDGSTTCLILQDIGFEVMWGIQRLAQVDSAKKQGGLNFKEESIEVECGY